MKINAITPGTKLNIHVNYKDNSFDTTATVLTGYGDGVLITPVYYDGKIIEYCSDASFEVTSPYTGHKRKFHIDDMSRVDFSGTDFHVIQGKEILISANNRKAERFKIQREASVVLQNQGKIKMSLVVNDLSLRGISLLVGKNAGLFNIGDEIDIDLVHEVTKKHIVFTSVVVRKFKVGDFDAIGCELKNISTSLLMYIEYKRKQKQENNDMRMFFEAI